MFKFITRQILLAGIMACLLFLAGCQSMPIQTSPEVAAHSDVALTLPADIEANRLRDPFIEAGVAAINEQDYDRASAAFNHALKLEPENPYLHFLNAYTYHLMLRQGDGSKTEMARVGYEMSRQFDNAAWWTDYFQGVLALEQRNYLLAQNLFVRALLLNDDNVEIMKGVITASYYLGDMGAALHVIEPALKQQPDDTSLIRSAALVYAAAGNSQQAEILLTKYEQFGLSDYRVKFLADRIHDWQQTHAFGKARLLPVNNQPDDDSSPSTPTTPATISDRQVVVDVVIIRSEERVADRRGINLLDGLAITFGVNDIKTITDIGPVVDPANPNAPVLTKGLRATTSAGANNVQQFTFPNVFSRSLSLPSVTYSLNIFNTIGDRNEILAKPSLMALDGEKSTFFSGAELTIGFAGTLQGGNLETKEVGVTLNVTPDFISEERVKLTIMAERDFFENFVPGGFEQSVQTSKNSVSASTVMNFGETLILSGLMEKETEALENKVPILGDIPLIKTLFNETNELEFNKSIIFMPTPRKPNLINASSASSETETDGNAEIIQQLFEQWHAVKTHSTSNSGFGKPQLSAYTRVSDINFKGWSNQGNVNRAVNTALQRLYD